MCLLFSSCVYQFWYIWLSFFRILLSWWQNHGKHKKRFAVWGFHPCLHKLYLPLKGIFYFPTLWIWVGVATHIDQQNLVELTLWDFQAQSLRVVRSSSFAHGGPRHNIRCWGCTCELRKRLHGEELWPQIYEKSADTVRREGGPVTSTTPVFRPSQLRSQLCE